MYKRFVVDGRFDATRDFEYRDYVLHLEKADFHTFIVGGVGVRKEAENARAKIVARRLFFSLDWPDFPSITFFNFIKTAPHPHRKPSSLTVSTNRPDYLLLQNLALVPVPNHPSCRTRSFWPEAACFTHSSPSFAKRNVAISTFACVAHARSQTEP